MEWFAAPPVALARQLTTQHLRHGSQASRSSELPGRAHTAILHGPGPACEAGTVRGIAHSTVKGSPRDRRIPPRAAGRLWDR